MNSPNSGEGLAFQALNDGTIDRALVIDASRRSLGLFVDAKVRVSDLTTLRGGSAVRLDDDCRLTLHRARLQRPSTGFCATKTSSASVDNVVVEGADGDSPSDICGLAPSAGVGFVLTDMSKLAARQVQITGSDDAALSFARPEALVLEDGRIDHNRVGLTAPANYLRGSLIRTRFEANPILFVPLP